MNGDERSGAGWEETSPGGARTRSGGGEEGHRANHGEETSAHLSERARCKRLFRKLFKKHMFDVCASASPLKILFSGHIALVSLNMITCTLHRRYLPLTHYLTNNRANKKTLIHFCSQIYKKNLYLFALQLWQVCRNS